MKKFIAIKHTNHCRIGQIMIAEEVGDPLFFCEIVQRKEGSVLRQTSMISIPFDQLAWAIVEMGFSLPVHKSISHPTETLEEQSALESELGDVIDDEVERRTQEADPSYKQKGGIALSNKGTKDEGSEPVGGG